MGCILGFQRHFPPVCLKRDSTSSFCRSLTNYAAHAAICSGIFRCLMILPDTPPPPEPSSLAVSGRMYLPHTALQPH